MRLVITCLLLAIAAADDIRWGIVVDCGSTGSRVHIYSWSAFTPIREFTPPTPEDEALLHATPGISTFANRPHDAAAYFAPLLVQAARWVPPAAAAATLVRALATAGMRLLSEEEQAPIWTSITEAISSSSFAVGGSMTLAGEYEGIFNWLSIQYILGGSASDATHGGLDLGGASTQITFRPTSGVIVQDAYRLVVNATTTRLYSHSYMRSGADQARIRLAQLIADRDGSSAPRKALANPCANLGLDVNYTLTCATPGGPTPCDRLLVGAGNHAACRVLTDALLNRANECLLPPCAAHGAYQPSPASVLFYAVSGYFYTANSLGLLGWDDERSLSAAQIATAGGEWCAQNWSSVAGQYRSGVCFSSAYIPSLLAAYGIARDDASAVTYARKIHGFSASWALGAQLYFIQEMKCAIEAAGAPSGGQCAPPDARLPRMEMGVSVLGIPTALALGGLVGVAVGSRRLRCAWPSKADFARRPNGIANVALRDDLSDPEVSAVSNGNAAHFGSNSV